MRAHLLQTAWPSEGKKAAFAQVRELLRGLAPAPGDLVVLPELFACGFGPGSRDAAEGDGKLEETAEFLSDAAQENRYESLHRLALGLAERGEPVVFLPDGTSIPWRNAILHDLVTTQHPDDRGGGYWTTLPDAPPDDTLRSTRAAYAALLFLLGSPAP